MAATIEKRRHSFYFPEEMLNDVQREALRLDRSLSWVVQQAWRLARGPMRQVPGTNDRGPDDGK